MNMKIRVFFDVIQYSLVGWYQCFKGTLVLTYQGYLLFKASCYCENLASQKVTTSTVNFVKMRVCTSMNKRKALISLLITEELTDLKAPAFTTHNTCKSSKHCSTVVTTNFMLSAVGGPPAWGLGEVLTTPHRKKV
jgi:hypothetical protein